MKKVFFLLAIISISFLVSCSIESTPSDLEPIINGQFKDNKAVFYPSTDYKTCAVVVDKNGNVWYLRLNGYGQVKDNKKLFNVNDFSK